MILAVCVAAALPMSANAVDLSRYVAIGDSLTAGYQSDGLVTTTQLRDFPALLARQAGISADAFQQPLISEPGIPPQLYLKSLLPLVVDRKPGMGQPLNLNLPRPYNNLGITGATSIDVLQTKTSADNPFFDLVLRKQGTVMEEAVALSPTFITFWVGNNDVLAAVLNGKAIDGVTMTPVEAFGQAMSQLFEILGAYQGRVVVCNIPSATNIAFTTAVSIYVTNPSTKQPVLINGQKVPLIGPDGPLTPGNYVTLYAIDYLNQGYGIPESLGGNGKPLPDEVVLNPQEILAIEGHINSYNSIIAYLAANNSIPVVDAYSFMTKLTTDGYAVGGVSITKDYLTGGFFSLDGIHPTDLGYAIIANLWIEKINGAFSSQIPLVNLNDYVQIGLTSSQPKADWRYGVSSDIFDNLKRLFSMKKACN